MDIRKLLKLVWKFISYQDESPKEVSEILWAIGLLFMFGILGFMVLTIPVWMFGIEELWFLVSKDENPNGPYINFLIVFIIGIPTKIIIDWWKK